MKVVHDLFLSKSEGGRTTYNRPYFWLKVGYVHTYIYAYASYSSY